MLEKEKSLEEFSLFESVQIEEGERGNFFKRSESDKSTHECFY